MIRFFLSFQVDTDMKVQADEFDGKVVYGQKKAAAGSG